MKVIRISIFVLLLSLIPTLFTSTARSECTTKAGIDVYVKDGQIVIEGKRNGSTSTPKPRIVTTTKPKPKPKATATPKYTYRPRTSSPRPRVTTPSLADKILQSLPSLQVAYQPEGKALTKVPIVFFTDLPTFFNKSYTILGEKVRINVKPKSLWSFGDGSTLLTNKPGKPYPSTEITHSYSVPGLYTVVVATIWDGTFTIGEVTQPLGQAIRQVSTVDVKVVGAGTRFVGK